MRVSIGDILTYGMTTASDTPTIANLMKLDREVYTPKVFDHLIYDRLETTHGKTNVFCWLFQNMTTKVAEALHQELSLVPEYLGAMDVDFAEPMYLQLFRNLLVESYRIHGKQCSIFYMAIEDERHNNFECECFEKHGFTIAYEDSGLRKTIFDNYNTIEHFKRVEDFKKVLSGFENIDSDQISDLTHSLEELHPKMFDVLASAAKAYNRAVTEEDYAQVALSCRRLLEKTADYLFPPSNTDYNGRKVGPAHTKNRLWAYIDQTFKNFIVKGDNTLTILGNELDRLWVVFNTGLHANPTQQKIATALSDLLVWLSNVIELAPEAARKPYLAYEEELKLFIKASRETQ